MAIIPEADTSADSLSCPGIPEWLGNAHRRVLGSGGTIQGMQRAGAMDVLLDEPAAAYRIWRGFSSECHGNLIAPSNTRHLETGEVTDASLKVVFCPDSSLQALTNYLSTLLSTNAFMSAVVMSRPLDMSSSSNPIGTCKNTTGIASFQPLRQYSNMPV